MTQETIESRSIFQRPIWVVVFALTAADAWFILLYSLLNTTLHYAFFYFGMSHNAGARFSLRLMAWARKITTKHKIFVL